jgi:hypothetical protein
MVTVKAGVDGEKAPAQRHHEGRQHHSHILGTASGATLEDEWLL